MSALCACWKAAFVIVFITKFASGQVQVVDSFNDSGLVWKKVSMNESEPFWYNTQTGESLWEDPRAKTAFSGPFEVVAPPRQASPREFLIQSTLLVMGVMGILFGSIGARWAYLYKHCPELLFPKKARKQRRRENNKMKQKRHRFKVSQDGKGGSSRNS